MAKENKPILRGMKGWKGYVWGYKKMQEAFETRWPAIKWGKEEDSGAKEIIKDELKGRTIYKF